MKTVKDFQKYFSKKPVTFLSLFFSLAIAWLLPLQVWAQKKDLTVSDKVTKVALIDHSRLRREYKEFSNARVRIFKQYEADKKTSDLALQLLDKQTKQDLRLDSIAGGKKQEEIIQLASIKRSELFNSFQVKQKNINQEKIALMQTYEAKINLAIAAVVNEGGFTEIKPLSPDATTQRSVDITNLILNKLN